MTRRVHLITRPALAAGFRLSGLAVIEAADAATAAAEVRRLATADDAGVILVDGRLYDGFPRELVARLQRQALPVVAPVPPPDWNAEARAEAYVLEILRQAIGYRVRPR